MNFMLPVQDLKITRYFCAQLLDGVGENLKIIITVYSKGLFVCLQLSQALDARDFETQGITFFWGTGQISYHEIAMQPCIAYTETMMKLSNYIQKTFINFQESETPAEYLFLGVLNTLLVYMNLLFALFMLEQSLFVFLCCMLAKRSPGYVQRHFLKKLRKFLQASKTG